MRRPPLAVVEQAPSPLGLKRWEGPVGRLPADSRGVIPGGRDGRRREGTSGHGPPPYPQSSQERTSMLGDARAPPLLYAALEAFAKSGVSSCFVRLLIEESERTENLF